MANKHPTSFRLAQDALDAIKELARLMDCSQAEAVEHLAREWRRTHRAEATEVRLEQLERDVAEIRRSLAYDREVRDG